MTHDGECWVISSAKPTVRLKLKDGVDREFFERELHSAMKRKPQTCALNLQAETSDQLSYIDDVERSIQELIKKMDATEAEPGGTGDDGLEVCLAPSERARTLHDDAPGCPSQVSATDDSNVFLVEASEVVEERLVLFKEKLEAKIAKDAQEAKERRQQETKLFERSSQSISLLNTCVCLMDHFFILYLRFFFLLPFRSHLDLFS